MSSNRKKKKTKPTSRNKNTKQMVKRSANAVSPLRPLAIDHLISTAKLPYATVEILSQIIPLRNV